MREESPRRAEQDRPFRVPPSVWIGLAATVLGIIVVLSGGFGWLAALLVPAVVLSVFLSFHVVRKLFLWDDGVAGDPESKKEERKEEG